MTNDKLSSRFKMNSPASNSLLNQRIAAFGHPLPTDYLRFLRQANGGEGFVGKEVYLVLWRVEELAEMNAAYHVAEFAPGLLIFGSDGGDEAFAFDLRYEPPPVVSIPFVGMELDAVKPIARSFEAFLEKLSHS
jgi:hypothetical protein